jgi:hypothetical protein
MTRDSEMDIDVPKQRAKSSSHVAERMRLYRKRRRQGLRSVRIWLPVTDIDYFLRLVLTERQRQRPDALQTELAGLIRQILDEMRDARAGYR